jgi:hypothetical protein
VIIAHPQNRLRSFHVKLEYHVCLTCLHLNRENNITRPHKEPAIVEGRRSHPAGSTAGSINRINKSTQRELSVFKRNTALPAGGRGRDAGASVGSGAGAGVPVEAIYRH